MRCWDGRLRGPERKKMETMRSILLAAVICGVCAMAGCGGGGSSTTTGSGGDKKVSIYLLPKTKGNPYFETCNVGAQEPAKELGDVSLTYDGPTGSSADPAN